MTDTQRTSRATATEIKRDFHLDNFDRADVSTLVTDYLAALDVLEWYAGNNSWVDYNGADRHHPKIRDGGNRAATFLASTEGGQP